MKQKRKYVTLVITESCNLSCSYCYEHSKTFTVMEEDRAKEIIKSELSADDDYEEVVIDFFGGEPFLEFSLIKNCLEYIQSQKWPKKLLFFATTNGTIVHEQIQDWLHQNKDIFWCCLSLDGTPQMHNINRSDSFGRIDLQFFREHWPKQPVKMTISRETLPNVAEGVIYLHEQGFSVLSNFAQGLQWNMQSNNNLLAGQLAVLIDYYLSHPGVSPCSLLNWNIAKICNSNDNRWCGAGVHMRTYAANGQLYPCHYFMPLSGMGEANTSFNTDNIDFRNGDSFLDDTCSKCCINSICPTCYGANYSLRGSVTARDSALCEFNKTIARANGYYYWKRIEKYGIEQVARESCCGEYQLLESIKMLQSLGE